MKCSICGRRLSDPLSVERGYGPVCYKRKFGVTSHARHEKSAPSTDETPDHGLPGQISLEEYLQMLSGR